MSVIGNIIWIIFGGLVEAIGWVLAGVLCMLTIVGIPVGLQCFKLAQLQLAPFGRKVKKTKFSPVGTVGNILWIIFIGWWLALLNLISAIFFTITIIGIPFALQNLKLAKLALMPFGREVV